MNATRKRSLTIYLPLPMSLPAHRTMSGGIQQKLPLRWFKTLGRTPRGVSRVRM